MAYVCFFSFSRLQAFAGKDTIKFGLSVSLSNLVPRRHAMVAAQDIKQNLDVRSFLKTVGFKLQAALQDRVGANRMAIPDTSH